METRAQNKYVAILPPDRTVICNIPNLDQTYVRTGIQGDGSCFLHAYLRATNLKYRGMIKSERKESVQILRERLAARVSIETIKGLGCGEHRKMIFFAVLNKIIEGGFPKNDEEGKLLNSIVNLNEILEKTTTFKKNFYSSFAENLIGEIEKIEPPQPVSDQLKTYIYKKCYDFFIETNEKVLDEFRISLLERQISSIEIEFISKQLEINFLFLRENYGNIEFYHEVASIDDYSWPFVIMLWIGETHYEILGRKELNDTITRKFQKEDEIVQAILKSIGREGVN